MGGGLVGTGGVGEEEVIRECGGGGEQEDEAEGERWWRYSE